jgi:hypothetical protein
VATKCDHVTWIGKEDKTQEIYEHVVYIKNILINMQRKIQGKIHCKTLKIITSLHIGTKIIIIIRQGKFDQLEFLNVFHVDYSFFHFH